MSDSPKQEKNNDSAEQNVTDDMLADLTFEPGWARRSPDETQYKDSGRHDRPQRGRSGRRDRSDRRARGDRGSRSGRPDRNERGQRGDRGDRDRRSSGQPRPDQQGRRPRPAGDDGGRRPGLPSRPPFVEKAPVDVSIVPDSRRLSAVVRRIRLAKRVYPLLDVARLFMQKPDSCRVKITARSNADGFAMFQCKTCGAAAGERAVVENHIVSEHMDAYFEKEEIEGEAPEGQFVCVARCGLSGTLLGPPNHHSYAERVQQLNETLYPNMPADEYRSHIETLRDEEAIEQWKAESRKQTVFRRKQNGQAPEHKPLSWLEARVELSTQIVPNQVTKTRRTVMPAPLALKMEDRSLLVPVRDAWRREERAPRTILFALKAAFRHMGLNVFRDRHGRDVVWAQRPSPLDKEHAVPSIRRVMDYVEQHPECGRNDVLQNVEGAQDEGSDLASEISWLVEKGHLMEYADGILVCPHGTGSPDNSDASD